MNLNEIIYLDLFSGVGGFSKGFTDAGLNIKKHYFSEIDKHAIAVYKYNFKNSHHAGDVRIISKRTVPERPNIVTFGFPCQDLSIAGKGKGLSGSRSGLFFEAIRIIKEFRPEIFIFENVKGLLSSNNGKDFETVLRTIADIGLYECEWQLVNTAWILPQNRERIYFIGHLRGKSKPGVFPFRESDPEFDNQQGDFTETQIAQCLQSPGNACGNYKGMNAISVGTWRTHKDGNGYRKIKSDNCPTIPARARTDGSGQPVIEIIQKTGGFYTTNKKDITGTLQAGGSNVMDKVPNIVVPNSIPDINKNKKANTHRTDKEGNARLQGYRVYETSGDSPALSSQQGGLTGGSHLIIQPILTPNRKEKRQNGRRFKEDGEPAFTLNTQDMNGIMITNERIAGWHENENVIAAHMNDKKRSTVQEEVYHKPTGIAQALNTAHQHKIIDTQIRRLTEIECERLQGFPDNWTEYGDYDGKIKKVSKTHRYKQMGNAVTTDWPRLIMSRILSLNKT